MCPNCGNNCNESCIDLNPDHFPLPAGNKGEILSWSNSGADWVELGDVGQILTVVVVNGVKCFKWEDAESGLPDDCKPIQMIARKQEGWDCALIGELYTGLNDDDTLETYKSCTFNFLPAGTVKIDFNINMYNYNGDDRTVIVAPDGAQNLIKVNTPFDNWANSCSAGIVQPHEEQGTIGQLSVAVNSLINNNTVIVGMTKGGGDNFCDVYLNVTCIYVECQV